MDENKLFVDDNNCTDDDCMGLSLDDASPDELDKLWDDADDDEIDVGASKKLTEKQKYILSALIGGAVVAVIGLIVYIIVKAIKKKD